MMQIFKGLLLKPKEAEELALYRRVAGKTIGIIETNGNLITSTKEWNRPGARERYHCLRKALERNSEAKGIVLGKDTITIDFRCIKYNLEEIKNLIEKDNLGVADSEKGLLLYRKKTSFYGGEWYQEVLWPLEGITTAMLTLDTEEVVRLNTQRDPADAEWKRLKFIA